MGGAKFIRRSALASRSRRLETTHAPWTEFSEVHNSQWVLAHRPPDARGCTRGAFVHGFVPRFWPGRVPLIACLMADAVINGVRVREPKGIDVKFIASRQLIYRRIERSFRSPGASTRRSAKLARAAAPSSSPLPCALRGCRLPSECWPSSEASAMPARPAYRGPFRCAGPLPRHARRHSNAAV